jgi:hypothetical protein
MLLYSRGRNTLTSARSNDAEWIPDVFSHEHHLPEVVRQQAGRWMDVAS